MCGHKPAHVETILVVDDDPEVRQSMSLFLDAKGYSVVEAEKGIAAYLRKPVKPDRLGEIIDQHCSV